MDNRFTFYALLTRYSLFCIVIVQTRYNDDDEDYDRS